MDFKHELEYYLYILNDESLTYQDKVEVLEEKIKERLKNMSQYINKAALVAEIEKRRKKNAKNKLNLAASFEDNYLLSFLDTLEVKDVDLD